MQLNKYWKLLFPTFLMLSVILGSCADPTLIGADILEDDRVKAVFTDTVTIHSRTIKGDSVVTYQPFNPVWLPSYLFGNYVDPQFGKTSAEIYAQPSLELATTSFILPNFNGAQLDSIVLVLPYSAAGFYGNTDQAFQMEVYELTDSLVRDIRYYSDTTINYAGLIGSKTFVPSLDSIEFIDYRTTTPDTISEAQLRVQLDDSFGNRIIQADSSNFLSNTDFMGFFKGLAIRASSETDGIISFALQPDGGAYDAGIYVYFTQNTVQTQYRFPISFRSAIVGRFENDYAGSTVEPFINSPDFSDSLAFLQGTQGLLVALDFPHLESLENVIVNKAELLIPIAALAGDDLNTFAPAEQLFAYYYLSESNTYARIDDVVLPAAGTAFDDVFGGLIVDGGSSPDFYRMNISAFFQEMLKDDRETDINDVLYLGVAPRAERASRSIIYGASHPQYPIKLNLTYTTQ